MTNGQAGLKKYRFKCPFNDDIECGRFEPKYFKRAGTPGVCFRCSYKQRQQLELVNWSN
jgi:hypothetical protein